MQNAGVVENAKAAQALADGKPRCPWCLGDNLYVRYHDTEWGVPVHDDRTHFEFLILEGFQAGLSWLTVLRKRERFREAFAGFDPAAVARFTEAKLTALLQDPGIIRNRAKVAASVGNAAAFCEIQEEYGCFDRYIWGFVDGRPVCNNPRTLDEVPATTGLSDRVSRDLKQRGFRFVGSTIIYAHLQATGIVNDHLVNCFRHRETREITSAT